MTPFDFPSVKLVDVTISDGGTSPVAGIDLGEHYEVVGLFAPSGCEGSSLTFTASTSVGGTFVPVIANGGAPVEIQYEPAKYVRCGSSLLPGLRFIKPVVSTQTGAAIFTLALEVRR